MSGRPELRIVRGEPTPEELAVLTAVVSAAVVSAAVVSAAAADGGGTDGGDTAGATTRRGRWSDPASMHRGSLLPGPGAWRATFR